MAGSMNVLPGAVSAFPVAVDHPLASVQSVRTATAADITAHPFYSNILNARVAEALKAYPPNEQTPQLKASLTASTIAQLIGIIGPIHVYQLADITVGSGQTLTYNGNWHEIVANAVTIAAGGVIRVIGTDPTISATLMLTCNSLGSS